MPAGAEDQPFPACQCSIRNHAASVSRHTAGANPHTLASAVQPHSESFDQHSFAPKHSEAMMLWAQASWLHGRAMQEQHCPTYSRGPSCCMQRQRQDCLCAPVLTLLACYVEPSHIPAYLRQLTASCMQVIFRRTFRPPTDWQDFLEFGYAVLAKVVASGCVHTVCHAIDVVCLSVGCRLGNGIEHLTVKP